MTRRWVGHTEELVEHLPDVGGTVLRLPLTDVKQHDAAGIPGPRDIDLSRVGHPVLAVEMRPAHHWGKRSRNSIPANIRVARVPGQQLKSLAQARGLPR